MPTVVAMVLFTGGCPVSSSSGDGGPLDGGDLGVVMDAGDVCANADASDTSPYPGRACCDEGHFVCWTPTYQCCHGIWIEYNDGPCMPRPDAGPPNCAMYPTMPGCPCAAGSTMSCLAFQARVECVGGVWTSSSTHACCL